MKLPRITIITPSLNQGAYLEKTIRSVLEQNYPDLEYFVIDGGSTDNSVEILQRYRDRFAYWVSEPDAGQAAAINKGLRRATGEIVAYLNSDDWYLPGTLHTVAETFLSLADRTSKPSWIVGEAIHYDEKTGIEILWRPTPPPADRWWIVGCPWGVPQVASFWRRELFEHYGYFREDMHYGFDTEWMIRLVLAGHPPYLLSVPLGARLLHAQCKSVRHERGFWEDIFRYHDLFSGVLTWEEQRKVLFRFEKKAIAFERDDGWLASSRARLFLLAFFFPLQAFLHRRELVSLFASSPSSPPLAPPLPFSKVLQKHLRSLFLPLLLSPPYRALRRRWKQAKLYHEIVRQPVRKLILGAGRTTIPGWIATDQEMLDVAKWEDWRRVVPVGSIDRLLAEHVFEHLSKEECRIAFQACYQALRPGGRLRIAVPDGYHPDPQYRESISPPHRGHRLLWTIDSLTPSLREVGFEVIPLEWRSSDGSFHRIDWNEGEGLILRSSRYLGEDRASLLLDARKPPYKAM